MKPLYNDNIYFEFRATYINLREMENDLFIARSRLQKHQKYKDCYWEDFQSRFSSLLAQTNQIFDNEYLKLLAKGDPGKILKSFETTTLNRVLVLNRNLLLTADPRFYKKDRYGLVGSFSLPSHELDLEQLFEAKNISFEHEGCEFSLKTHKFYVIDINVIPGGSPEQFAAEYVLKIVPRDNEEQKKEKSQLQALQIIFEAEGPGSYIQNTIDDMQMAMSDIELLCKGINDFFRILDEEDIYKEDDEDNPYINDALRSFS